MDLEICLRPKTANLDARQCLAGFLMGNVWFIYAYLGAGLLARLDLLQS